MTLEVFPTGLLGLTFGTKVTPNFNTSIQTSADGHETRNQLAVYPTYDIQLSYEWLLNRRDGIADLETIQAFFLNRKGAYEAFLYDGPETPTQTATSLGTGNGVTTSFQLVKTTLTFSEPAGGVASSASVLVYLNGVLQASGWSLVDHRYIVFVTPPGSGVAVTATYKPLYRCRFKEDMAEYEQFASLLWDLQEINLKSIL